MIKSKLKKRVINEKEVDKDNLSNSLIFECYKFKRYQDLAISIQKRNGNSNSLHEISENYQGERRTLDFHSNRNICTATWYLTRFVEFCECFDSMMLEKMVKGSEREN